MLAATRKVCPGKVGFEYERTVMVMVAVPFEQMGCLNPLVMASAVPLVGATEAPKGCSIQLGVVVVVVVVAVVAAVESVALQRGCH